MCHENGPDLDSGSDRNSGGGDLEKLLMQTTQNTPRMKSSFARRIGLPGAILAFVMGLSGLWGQGTTTSALSGRIVDADGKPVPEAEVTLVHVPTGSN